MITDERQYTDKPTFLHTYIQITLHPYSHTLQPLSYLANPTLPYTYILPTHVQSKKE